MGSFSWAQHVFRSLPHARNTDKYRLIEFYGPVEMHVYTDMVISMQNPQDKCEK